MNTAIVYNRMRFARPLLILSALCASATMATAQSLSGSITDSTTQQPIAGVVVSLLDSAGGVLGRLLTGDRGSYHVPQAASVRRLRLQRLGYRMRDIRVPSSTESTIRLDIRLVALPSLLDPVETMSSSQCPRRADGPKAFSLLEQARAALLNTIVARDQNPAFLVRLQYQRLYDADKIIRQYVRVDSTETAKRSFTAVRSGADFVRDGFSDVKFSGEQYYGPDAEVLLDDGFAAGYCFRLADRDRKHENQVGLAFSAANRKRGRVDIDGILWIDTLARTLRTVEYKYVGLPAGVRGRAEGMTSFRDVANGVVFIDRWFIRLPEQQHEIAATVTTWWAETESGGEVARASWPDGASWKNSLGTLTMLALKHDSTSAPGTAVRLVDTDYLGVADTNGNIRIADLLPGPYRVAVIDTILAAVHIVPVPIFAFSAARDSTVSHAFEVKTAGDYTFDRCVGDKPAPRVRSMVLLLGKVEDGMGRPVRDAKIEFAAVGSEPFTDYKTGDDGVFSLCLPASARMQSLAVWFRDSSGKKRNYLVTLNRELTTMLINVDGR